MYMLRESLLEKTPISDLCQKQGAPPACSMNMPKKLLEQGAGLFDDQVGSTRPDTSPYNNNNIATGSKFGLEHVRSSIFLQSC